jgi:hypothetical protein
MKKMYVTFWLIGVLVLITGCGGIDNSNNNLVNTGVEQVNFTTKSSSQNEKETLLENHQVSGNLQAINEDFNFETIHGLPPFPEQGLIYINKNGHAVYDNGVIINRRGMLMTMPNEELSPAHYRAYIRSAIYQAGREVVYVNGKSGKVTKAFYKESFPIENVPSEVALKVKEDVARKLNILASCYDKASFNPALREYLGGTMTILEDAYDDNNYTKYVEGVKRVKSLNFTLNETY